MSIFTNRGALLLTFLTLLLNPAVHAIVKIVPQTSQHKVKVTLYNNLAFVEETRKTNLETGMNKLLINGVPDSIIMDTFFVRFISPLTPLTVSEYTFQSPHLTREELLSHSVGEPIYLLPTATSSSATPGILLALDGEDAIVKAMDMIFSVKKNRVGFPHLPHTLVPEPIIKLKVEARKAGEYLFEMGYLAKGFSWNATYTIIVDAAEGNLDLTNWINIRNESGMDVKKGHFRIAFTHKEGERFYNVQHPLTIADQAVKNISWLTADKLTPIRSFRIYPTNKILENEEGVVMKPPVETWLSVKNDPTSGLGIHLPHGSIRVFRRNADGSLMYVGENKTQSVPVGDSLSLRLGSTKDITVDMRQTDYRKLGSHVVESGYRLDLKNMTKDKKHVTFFQNVSGEWTVLRETHPHEEEENRLKWTLALGPNESVSLRYRIRMNVREL